MQKQLIVAVLTLALSGGALAQNFYGSIGAGVSRADLDCEGVATCDRDGTAVRLFGGYRLTPAIAVEAGFLNFGKAKAGEGGLALDVSNSGFGGGLALRQDLSSNWSLGARMGVVSMKTKVSASAFSVINGSDSDRNAVLYGGLGLGYKLNSQTSIDGGFEVSKGKYDKNNVNTSGDLTALTLGVTFGF